MNEVVTSKRMPEALIALREESRAKMRTMHQTELERTEKERRQAWVFLLVAIDEAVPLEAEPYIDRDEARVAVIIGATVVDVALRLPQCWPIVLRFSRFAGGWQMVPHVGAGRPMDASVGDAVYYLIQRDREDFGTKTLGAALVLAQIEEGRTPG